MPIVPSTISRLKEGGNRVRGVSGRLGTRVPGQIEMRCGVAIAGKKARLTHTTFAGKEMDLPVLDVADMEDF